jgi:VanZ family protein
MAIPERSHLMEYSVLAVFIYEALLERVSRGRHVTLPAVTAILATSLAGILDECIQAVLPNRVVDWRDILFNILAAVAAVAGLAMLRWARRRATERG